MSHSHTLFQSLVNISRIIVKLRNGATITTTQSGTIQFTNTFYLTDVLYIPEFFTNIISIPRLTKSLNCRVTFNSSSCMIQGTLTQRMIGGARLHQSLYYLTNSTNLTPIELGSTMSTLVIFGTHALDILRTLLFLI